MSQANQGCTVQKKTIKRLLITTALLFCLMMRYLSSKITVMRWSLLLTVSVHGMEMKEKALLNALG